MKTYLTGAIGVGIIIATAHMGYRLGYADGRSAWKFSDVFRQLEAIQLMCQTFERKKMPE